MGVNVNWEKLETIFHPFKKVTYKGQYRYAKISGWRTSFSVAAFSGAAAGALWLGITSLSGSPDSPANDTSLQDAANQIVISIGGSNEAAQAQTNGQKFESALRSFRGVNHDGQDYFIAGANVVETSDGASNYAYNFDTEIVTIDGPEGADSVMTFRALARPQAVGTARKAGCLVTEWERKKFPDLDAFKLDESLQQQKDAVLRNRDNFRERYCKEHKPG